MKSVILVLILSLTLPTLGAQAVLTDIQFIPPTFFVGDLVELRIEFTGSSAINVEIPEYLPETDWIDIRDIRIEELDNAFIISIDFTPFATGIRTLPSLNLGTIQLQDIKIPTHSMLQSSHEGVRRLRGQLLLPGTRLGLSFILALVAMAPFLIYTFSKLILKWFKRIGAVLHIRWPAYRLRRLLRRLRGDIGIEYAPDWFTILTDGIRTYLSVRMDYDCRSATTAEISTLMDIFIVDSPQKKILEILKESDMVKFARRFADETSLNRTLTIVESAVAEWEKTIVQH